jgi:CMP-N-acetylneuraminic acid synthetase
MRPLALTEDGVTTQQVLQNTLEWLEEHEGYVPDYVLLLYATSPLLKRERIEEAISLATKRDSDSVISGFLDKGYYWIEVEGGWERLYPKKVANSQWLKPLFVENGAIYLTKSTFIKKQYVADKADIVVMDENENIDVDYPEDFERVESILKNASR